MMGSCGVRTVKDNDGNIYELVLRDCGGDNYTAEPQKVILKRKSGRTMIIAFPGALYQSQSQNQNQRPHLKRKLNLMLSPFKVPLPFDLPEIHLTVAVHNVVFLLPKFGAHLSDDDYSKYFCDINAKRLRNFMALFNRSYSKYVNSHIMKINTQATYKVLTSIGECLNKSQDDNADKEKIIADMSEAFAKFRVSLFDTYYNSEGEDEDEKDEEE